MGIRSSLNPEITPKDLIDLWLFNFAKHKDSIDLSSYEDTIQFNMANIISQGGNHTSQTKTFPVIFHALIDTPKLLTPSGGDVIDFNVAEILKDINHAFSSAGIQFKAVKNDEEGNPLDYPGLNIINVLNLQEQRINTTTSTPSANDIHRYTENGVAISERYETTITGNPANQTTILQEGVSLDSIYSEFSWSSDRVINIFLINGFSSSLLDVQYAPALIASNPFLYDSIKLDGGADVNFNITLPFWALGRPYIDAETPGYGYRYTTVEEDAHNPDIVTGTHYINNQIASKLGAVSISDSIDSLNYYGGYYVQNDSNKAIPLIKGLGHLFGLANIVNVYPTDAFRVFTTGSYFGANSTPNAGICYATSFSGSCFYKRFNTWAAAITDCSDDTANSGGIYITNNNRADELCNQNDIEVLNNYMYNSNIIGNSLFSANYFSPQQILRMHANIDINYLDTVTGASTQGVLKRILNTNTPIFDHETILSCADGDEVARLTINRSLAINFDDERLTLNETFEQTKNNIINIVNSF